MDFKNISVFFLITLPLSLCARFFQIIFIEDPATGFFIRGYEIFGYFFTGLIVLCAVVNVLISFTAYQRPAKPPRVNLPLGISSIALGLGIGSEILTETFTAAIRVWQITVLDILGIFTAVFFILYGLKMIIDFPLPKFFTIVPALYWIMRLICIFTSISAISIITDNLVTLASHCSVLIFMANFSKLFNGIDSDRVFRKILASGVCSIILCVVDALPRLYFSLFGEGYIHAGVSSAVSVLLSGIFITSFIFTYFKQTVKRKSKHLK